MQTEMFNHAVHLVEGSGLYNNPMILVGHESWHPGLAGLVAGQLKEKYNKPAIVVTWTPGAAAGLEGRGSGRSVPGVNLGAAFIEAKNAGLLIKGGGHAMAAGFTVLPERLEDFRQFLLAHVTRQLQGEVCAAETRIDGVLSVRGATPELVKTLRDHVGPFGQGHEEPVFVLPHVRLYNVDIVGADHVRALVGDWEGGGRLKAVAFRAKGTPLGDTILRHWRDTAFHLAGSFKINTWQGREQVEMHIEDAAPVFAAAEKRFA
jgi:single-stranded-DNA-specific exonuclease